MKEGIWVTEFNYFGANINNRKLLFCDFKKGVLFVFTMNDDFGGPLKQGI